MRRVTFAGAFLLVLSAVGFAYASASYAREVGKSTGGPFAPPFLTSSAHALLERELAVYTRRGLSAAHAARAVAAQEAIAKAAIVSKVQAALGSSYAGVWLDPSAGQIRVGVTSTAAERQVQRIASAAGLASSVVATRARSTWSQLSAAQQRWRQRLQRLFVHEEVKTDINPQRNALEVTLGSSVSSSERTRLRRQARDAAVNVLVGVVPSRRVSGIPDIEYSACRAFAANKAYCDKPLASGVTIISEFVRGVWGLCTGGPMVIPTATKLGTYLLTAGHCIALEGGNGNPWYSLESNEAGTIKEIGRAYTYVRGEKGDFGAIRINEPGLWTSGIANDPLFAATAEWGNPGLTSFPIKEELQPMLNATSCHEGQSSGYSCGEIKALSTEVTVRGVIIKGLTEVIKMEKAPEEGDSGGPELKLELPGDQALIEGTMVGGAVNEPKTLFFDPIQTVLKELKTAQPALNVELLTQRNEIRPQAKWLKAGVELTKEEPATTDGEWFFHHKVPGLFGGGEFTLACSGTLKGDVSLGGADKVTVFLGLHGEKENEVLCKVSASTNSLCKVGATVLVKALHLPWVTKLEETSIGEEEHIVDALSAEASTPGWEATCSSIKTSCSTNDRARFVQNLANGAMFELTGELSASCSDGGTATTTGHSEVLGFAA